MTLPLQNGKVIGGFAPLSAGGEGAGVRARGEFTHKTAYLDAYGRGKTCVLFVCAALS